MATLSTASPPPPPKEMVKRKITGGGPFNGRGITVPVDLKRLDCGWLTAHYELVGNEFRFKSKANAGYGDCPEGWR